MDDINLPNHVVEKVERRWASRLAADAAAWRRNKPTRGMPQAVTDRHGNLVPVAFRRSPVMRGTEAFAQIA